MHIEDRDADNSEQDADDVYASFAVWMVYGCIFALGIHLHGFTFITNITVLITSFIAIVYASETNLAPISDSDVYIILRMSSA